MPLHARTYPPRCTLLPLLPRLLFAPAHVLHAKTYFLRPSLLPMFVASLCSCTCAPYKDLSPQAITATSLYSFYLPLRMRSIQRQASSGRHCTLYLQLLSVSAQTLPPSTSGSDAVCIGLGNQRIVSPTPAEFCALAVMMSSATAVPAKPVHPLSLCICCVHASMHVCLFFATTMPLAQFCPAFPTLPSAIMSTAKLTAMLLTRYVLHDSY